MKNERLDKIVAIIEKHGQITYAELGCLLGDVSTMTIRRDIKMLEDRGIVMRTQGGAASMEHISKKTHAAGFVKFLSSNIPEKQEIARKAAALVSPHSCVFVGGGSTTEYFVKELPEETFFIVTNGLNIAIESLKNNKCSVSILGGDVQKNNLLAVGRSGLEHLSKINIDTAVIGANGFNMADLRFTCGSQSEGEIKQAVIRKAKSVIILLDSSKLNRNSPYNFATLSDVNYLVVDKFFPKEFKTKVENFGVKVI